jgi:hypothetical protein
MHALSCVELMNQWRRQVAWRRRPGQSPRGLGGLAWLTPATPSAGLVDLQDLTIVVAYDELQANDQLATRIAGYRAVRVDHGVQWGGREQLRFSKNLLLAPRPGGGYQRLDLLNAANLGLALRLNRRIDMALVHQTSAFRRTLRLPVLWAGFAASIAETVVGEGPEIEQLCGRFGLEPAAMLRKFQRTGRDLTFLPLEWVGDQLPLASRVCAEVEGFPRLQVFGVSDLAVDLVGFAGAMAYDFAAKPAVQPHYGLAGRVKVA